MECVWQMQHQNPSAFEFNEYFLICILDQLLGCRFGTFLFESEKERLDRGLAEKTPSLWSFLDQHRSHFINPFFQVIRAPLYVDARPWRLEIFRPFYFRWHQSFHRSEPASDRASKVLWRAKQQILALEKQVQDLQAKQ